MVASPYSQTDQGVSRLRGLGFESHDPIYSVKAVTFVSCFAGRKKLTELLNYPSQHVPYERVGFPQNSVHPAYEGSIIFATPGSGKTYMGQSAGSLIHADTLILEEIAEQHPSFRRQ
jgi:SpoVK/Ycf46/Vps4 family AAA+-type ATPase